MWTKAKYEERLFLENRDFVCVQRKQPKSATTAVSYKMDSIRYSFGVFYAHHFVSERAGLYFATESMFSYKLLSKCV